MEEAAQLKSGEVDKVIEARVKAARSGLEKQMAGISAERET